MAASDRATMREAQFEDCTRVVHLARGLGVPVATEPDVARSTWESLWRTNPTMTMNRAMPALGWVLEAEERIVGFFGNIPIRYQFGTQELLVGVGTAWAIEKRFRGQTDDLAGAYFGQEEVDLCLGTTGIPAAGRLFHRHSGEDVPLPDYDRVLYWVVDVVGFSQIKLRGRLGRVLPSSAAEAVGTAISPVLAGAIALKQRRPGRLSVGLEPEAITPVDIGAEFDELWRRKVTEGTRLYASRSATDLRWHLEPREGPRDVTVLRCRRGGRLVGYLIWERKLNPISGLIEAVVVDLLVEANDVRVIDALFASAFESARAQRCHILVVTGFPKEIREHVCTWRPLSWERTPHSFSYKARSPALQTALGREDAWYPTPFDGDGTLFGPLAVPAASA